MIIYPAEWAPQHMVQLTWPNKGTDWYPYLNEAYECFIRIATSLHPHVKLLVVCNNKTLVKAHLSHLDEKNILIIECETNDTWARDHGVITILKNGKPVVYDFQFNGWGNKFEAALDNQITKKSFEQGIFSHSIYSDKLDFVLEGGSLESNGDGILLTTSKCLLNKNRNDVLSKQEIENRLITLFGLKKVLWLNYGFLEGDDTDSHIDTLARFIDAETIMYVKCTNKNDIHFTELEEVEKELASFTNERGKPFQLIPLPMATAVFDEEGNRLPATYANFLFSNNIVLVPVYNIPTDKEAIAIFEKAMPDREIIPVDCSVLIKQHGSLHCVTMNYPKGVE